MLRKLEQFWCGSSAAYVTQLEGRNEPEERRGERRECRWVRTVTLALAALAVGMRAEATDFFEFAVENGAKSVAQHVWYLEGSPAVIHGTGAASDTDFYRLANQDLGQFECTAQVLNLGTSALTASIVGLQQTNGVIQPVDQAIVAVTVLPGAANAKTLRWYVLQTAPPANGWLHLKLQNTSTTIANDYEVTVTSTIMSVPTVVQPASGYFQPGNITFATTATTNTDMWLYDSSFTALPNDPILGPGGNDNESSSSNRSRVTRFLSDGRYYLAISDANLANDQASDPADGNSSRPVNDYGGAVLCGGTLPGLDLSLTITDSSGPISVAATKPAVAYGVRFLQIQVGPTPPGVAAGPFCFGDGLDPNFTTQCPCGNFGTPGHGCGNSFNPAGAVLVSMAGGLEASGMSGVTCLIFQGDALDDAVFGDGVRCTGGNLRRISTTAFTGGGAAQVSQATILTRGQVTVGSGATRYYQTFYRNASPSWCPPATFNGTNGYVIVW
ncbi:MAG: hypothetical protein HZA53_09325 [Planctomycetes bacterium]|nr:hypothetical protein [Planctomycetota bacterium]